MTKPLPFTQASIKRQILAIEAAGKFAVAVKPDGTVIVGNKPVDVASLMPVEQSPPSGPRFGDKLGWPKDPAAPKRSMQDYLKPTSKWEDKGA